VYKEKRNSHGIELNKFLVLNGIAFVSSEAEEIYHRYFSSAIQNGRGMFCGRNQIPITPQTYKLNKNSIRN
jgi:endonuclease YncB( thermonuclease family)